MLRPVARWGILVAVLLTGCEARLLLGAACALDSECPEPFVCRNARCRVPCATARDCPRGSICVTAEGGVAGCQLAVGLESCSSTADCGGRLECLDGRCTTSCSTDGDCLAGARCAPGAGCVECVSDGDCAFGLRCGEGHVCTAECASDADCTGGLSCVASRCTIADGGLRDAGPGFVPDHCEDAERIALTGPFVAAVRRSDAWTADPGSCSTQSEQVDGFFSFEIAQRAIVFVHADSSSVDLGWVDDCASGTARCESTSCDRATGTDVELAAVLDPGVYTFVVSAIASSEVTLSIAQFVLPDGAFADRILPGTTDRNIALGGSMVSACGPSGPSAFLYGRTCTDLGGGLDMTACGVDAPLTWTVRYDAGGTSCFSEPAGCAAPSRHAVAFSPAAFVWELIANTTAPTATARVSIGSF